jgi:excisionase family DNA binding protein
MRTDLLTTAEVAALLQVHPKHVYRLLRRGLPAHRMGGEWRFVHDEVVAWLEGAAPRPPSVAEVARDAPPPLVAANGDVAVELLLARLNRQPPQLGFVQSDRAQALALLERGAVLVAGCHGQGPPARLGAARLARIHLVRREVGLVARGPRVPSVSALGRARFATRPASAGIVLHLERALAAAGSSLRAATARARVYASHREVVCAVARGDMDVGLATHAWARRVGLSFRALAWEDYGLLVRAADLGDARVVRLCEVVQRADYRADLDEQAGYDGRLAGDIRYDTDDADARSSA